MTVRLRPWRQPIVHATAARARSRLVKDQAAMRRRAEEYDRRQAERAVETKEPPRG